MKLDLQLHSVIDISPTRGAGTFGFFPQNIVQKSFKFLHHIQEETSLHMVHLGLLAGAAGVKTVSGAAPLLPSLSEDATHVPQLLVDRQHLRLQIMQTNRILGIITLDIVQVLVYITEGSKTDGRSDLVWTLYNKSNLLDPFRLFSESEISISLRMERLP